MIYSRVLLVFLAGLSVAAQAAQPTFRDRYNEAAKDLLPQLQTTGCETKSVNADKAITECKLQSPNALLSLDSMNNKLSGVWLVVDATKLANAAEVARAGGVLVRAARGTAHGNHLAVATDVFELSRKNGWNEACKEDLTSTSRLCVSAANRSVYHFTLSPL